MPESLENTETTGCSEKLNKRKSTEVFNPHRGFIMRTLVQCDKYGDLDPRTRIPVHRLHIRVRGMLSYVTERYMKNCTCNKN